ncbi:short-chain dehydrogenase/reductase SDR [Russula earlei]|uniref:Short-chain dehydrogenase/reductase SDR n=1 Tax=Russula earlei TaxID=71964 RepID=A0ACC0TU29_9AGAM|nr:short-chain dehydrogenase/reductase SDR [Russula earlei]
MDLQITNKKALVTGSTAGIGYSIAKHLALEGAVVVMNGRTEKRVQDAIEQLTTETGSTQISGVLPDIDILVNNVGIFEPKEFRDISDADWVRFFEVNGRIIFISSESGVFIPSEMIHYGMTKTAQLAVARGLAELTKGTGVTVNTVLPGPTKSEGVGGFLDNLAADQGKTAEQVETDFFTHMRPTSLVQRFLSTDEIANMVTYLASPLSSATNGAALRAEGGLIRSIY